MEKCGWERRVGIKPFLNHVLEFLLNREWGREVEGFSLEERDGA